MGVLGGNESMCFCEVVFAPDDSEIFTFELATSDDGNPDIATNSPREIAVAIADKLGAVYHQELEQTECLCASVPVQHCMETCLVVSNTIVQDGLEFFWFGFANKRFDLFVISSSALIAKVDGLDCQFCI
jgi:hypothetical protein